MESGSVHRDSSSLDRFALERLASPHYCHFTSPIRRYPDLTVHRMIAEYCRGKLDSRPPEDISQLVALGEHCSQASRRAEAAERELRQVLVLQLLATKVGKEFDGVITGVANFGLFVQMPRFNVEGLVRMEDLGDDWWEVDVKRGQVTGERSKQTYALGTVLDVRIVSVEQGSRQMKLSLSTLKRPARRKKPQPVKSSAKGKTATKKAKTSSKGKGRGRSRRRSS